MVRPNNFNIDVFNLSMEGKHNFWFLDTHHVALSLSYDGVSIIEDNFRSKRANGVHITYRASDVIRGVIRRCFDELYRGSRSALVEVWPLRTGFRRLAASAR